VTSTSGNAIRGAGNPGVLGQGNNGPGIQGVGTVAGQFNGDVQILGNSLVIGSKNFRIDHPLDPANKYLNHFAIESSEVLNMYSGTIILDQNGEATIQMPDWFESVNKDFRYKLTPIGSDADLYISQELVKGKFKIAGGKARMKVSWEISGVRHNPGFNPLPVEQIKADGDRGLYLDPDAYGQPIEKSISGKNPEVLEILKQQRQNAGRLKTSNK
ncbi:MAG: hypothetical protein HY819_01085, partial [Acidobacteria bacterium]|nr:hypothetical protein [Acidobacteriota bacterium]